MFSKKFFSLALFFFLLAPLALAVPGPIISSSTHPDPEKWYKSNSPSFEIETAGTGYSYKLDLNSLTIPDEIIDPQGPTVSYKNRASGVQYFHARVKSGGTWSDTTHFKIMVDKAPPKPPKNLKATPLDRGSIELTWGAGEDTESGIAGYKIYRSFLRDFDILFDFYEVIAEKAEGTSFVDDTTVEGKNYHYRLQAIDNVGNIGGLTKTFFATVPTKCDFEPSIETSLDNDVLSITIDSSPHIMNFATLVLKPVQGDEIKVFSSRSGTDLFLETVDVSGLPDQEILIDFDVRDESDDACDVQKTFFLDRVDPEGEWVFPVGGEVFLETVLLNVLAFDKGSNPSGISKVEFFYDDGGLQKIGEKTESMGKNFVLEWDSLKAPNGRYSFVAKIFDKAKNFVEKRVTASIKNTALIRADTNSAILTAKQKRESAVEMRDLMETVGVESEEFFDLMQTADSNLSRAIELFEVGINFERAKIYAGVAGGLYERASVLLSIKKNDSLLRVFKDEEKESGLKKIGLKDSLIPQATRSLEVFAPARRADIYKVVAGNETFYKLVFVLTMTGANFNKNNVQIIESIPKGLGASASGLRSFSDFEILNSQPVVKFVADLNKSKKVSYSLGKKFSKSEANKLVKNNPLKLFESLPIVLNAGTKADSSTVVRPFDLFEVIEPITSEYDAFTLALIGAGVLAALIVVIGIISFFIVLLAVLKSR